MERPEPPPVEPAMTVSSPALDLGDSIPMEFTAEGSNIAPPLRWCNVPAETVSVAVLVDDPDAPLGTFTHWIVIGIPPYITNLPAGGELPGCARHGRNDAGTLGWSGPDPVSGRHRYVFAVLALDIELAQDVVFDRTRFHAAIDGHVIARGELVATYERKLGPDRSRPGMASARR